MTGPTRGSRLIRTLFGGAIALLAAGCATLGSGRPDDHIRILVYNIHAGKDTRGIDNLSRVSALILDQKADIVLLQEVDRGTTRSGRVDQAIILARLTDMHFAFGKTLEYQGGDYGIAILSRWRIDFDTLHRLPIVPAQARAGGSYEPRGALEAVIRAPGGAIPILNTHIDASREDFYRRQEMTTLLRLVTRGPRGVRQTSLLGGDLNAEPGSAVIAMLRGSAVRDPWAECGSGAGLTYPAGNPVKRIDYLLLPAEWRCVSAKVIETEVSDHRPVLFEIMRAR